MKQCPSCQAEAMKVIYLGLPMLLCSDENCNALFGFWSWIPGLVPISTEGGLWAFFGYEGSYLKGLWFWLTGDLEEDDQI